MAIEVLDDIVANQIAAGEVVNRPASVVKELLENAMDAGATRVQLVIRDAGKTLIQVSDNGCGMDKEDAQKCFLPHATSKIKSSEDLLNLHTMGFRGEALASIAAIAQVELKTRREEDETGVRVVIEGGVVKEVCETACYRLYRRSFLLPGSLFAKRLAASAHVFQSRTYSSTLRRGETSLKRSK